MSRVLIIDYGMGNLGSVKRALEECGAEEVVISNYPEQFDSCTHAILPGVGAFPDAMKNLHELNLVRRIKHLAENEKIPFLGICLGMQLLAEKGFENAETEGLAIIPGQVKILKQKKNEKIPHVGWNEINIQVQDKLLNGIADKSDFYFVHSYHFITEPQYQIASTPYCGDFSSIVAKENVIGVQFHPEKSSTAGFQLLRNFLSL